MMYLKPLPEIREENVPFWDGLRERTFRVPRCDECGDYNWPPYPACRSCLGEQLTWTPVAGTGELYSFTVVHRGPGPFDADVPYVIALVRLDESPRPLLVLGNVVDGDGSHLEVGMRMRIAYEDVEGEDVTLWRFTPAGEEG
jgi:uncharacterized protein